MEESELSFEEISTWTVASLKDYLRIRGLKQTGNKTKLIALVYGASQLGVQPKPNEVEEDRKRSEQYRKVLKICGKTLPDPLSELNDNWKGEKEGVHCWPPVSYYEIAEWLLRDAPCKKNPSTLYPGSCSTQPAHQKKSPSTQGLYNAMLASCQDSTLFRYLEDDHKISTPIYPHDATFNEVLWVSKEVEVETIPNVPIPQPLPALAVGTNTISEFLDQLPEYTVEEVSQIELATRGQFDNP
ncbi:hypothetical protein HOLleu_24465 [Holothuria leucospilota]|uniref:SAP domain-containing protein n=1 Tax=Holothuria leucospilota TaxID=206669 RepID=A0A9Q1H3K0_HOLLE|nr:hypothetical protein HOLleu_24465 [Holothuria leucospilota]